MEKSLVRAVLAVAAVGLVAVAGSADVGSAGRSLTTVGWSSHLTGDQVHLLSANADQRVIVLLRNQHTGLTGAPAEAQRTQAFAADRAPIVAQLRQLNAPRLVTYHTVNALATTVSAAEAANLRRDPAVLALGPDAVIKGPSPGASLLPGVSGAPVSKAVRPRAATSSSKVAVSGSALCGNATAPLLEPQALHLINADNRTHATGSITSGPKSAHSLGYTGAGVNVAVFPDGMDPNLPDFQRNGQSAITDYRDFTGEGAFAPTGGGEAFGDVSSLVAQGNTTYNLNQQINPAFAGSGSCDVKVLGVAPGADVDLMKVFGSSNVSFTSVTMQGIDWAIQHDHANILSISFGFPGLPTSASQQAMTAILANAMADGTTVVASTGDSSPSNTEGSPALNPGVIGVAASTSYRLLAQTNFFLYSMGQAIHGGGAGSYHLGQSTPGWLDNQVSTLSSSGVTEDRRVPDLIAPGDLNWAVCSTDTSTYTECENDLGGSSIGLEEFGGTSESAPLTAGVAALVIEAYRKAHHDQTPTPAVVRQILFSSATDLGVAAENQGAGLVNALRAVQLAAAFGKHAKGGVLVHSPDSIADLGNVKVTHRHTVTVKNTGGSTVTVKPALRTLGPAHTLASGKLNLFMAGRGAQGSCGAGHTTAKYFNNETIPELNCKTFNVPKHVDALDSRIGWQPLQSCSGCTAGEPTVREILIDPKGRYTQYSDPQGDGSGFADEQVHQPLAGKWTLLIFGRSASNYEGAVSYQETAQTFRSIRHAVMPASKVLRPGKSTSFTVKVPAPVKPGVITDAVVFYNNRASKLGTIPVVSEAKVAVTTKKAGHFTGTLIGGNGRPGAYAQELSYEFTVPKGVHDLDINMKASHDGYVLLGQLVDPNGNAVDNQLSVQQIDAFGENDNTNAVQLVWANPRPGTWRVNVGNGLFYLPGLDVYSGLTHATLKGTVSFNTSRVTATGMPSGTLTPGSTVTAQVKVKNTGVEPETYQLDPRTLSQTPYDGVSLTNTSGTLPITFDDTIPEYIVPPFSSQLKVTTNTTGSTPIQFDLSPYWGSPSVVSPASSVGATSITLTSPFASAWAPAPSELGPFVSPATPEDYSTSATVTTLGFDHNVTPSTGNWWDFELNGGTQPHSLFLLPGESGMMSLTFTVPAGTPGTPVTGVIPVETFPTNSVTTGIGDWSSDVLKYLQYSYTLG
jgi:hypothetical protein